MVDSGRNQGELGGYPLGREIDKGPGLTIYESEDGFGRSVQVHCFDSEVVKTRIGRDEFFEEVRKSASVSQESSGLLLDMGEKGDDWYVVFLVPDAPSLRTLIQRGGQLAEERVRVVAEGATAALVQLHAEGLRHGDLRPETIYLSGGNVGLGPRRLLPLTPEERNPHYLSPEEMRGDKGDIRSDLFVLAEVLYEALTGQPALPHEDKESALALLRSDPPALPADTAQELATLVTVLLSEDPDDRPTDPGTVARVLAGEITLPPPRRPTPAGSPVSAEPAAPEAAEAIGATRRTRGGRGRLHVPADKGIACFDLFEDPAWIGTGSSGSLTLTSKEEPASVARIETEPDGSTIFCIEDRSPRVRVNGSLIDVHLLDDEDVINVGDAQVRYERLKPEPTRTPPARPRPPPKKKDILPVLVTVLLCFLVVGIGVGRLQKESGRGEDGIRKARELVKQANESDYSPPAEDSNDPAPGDAGDVGPADSRERRLAAAREAALVKDYREMVAEVRSRLEEDSFYDGHLLYRNFSDDHENTRFADRARGAANDLLELIEFRFVEDRTRVLSAMSARDFEVVEGILDRIEIYGTPAMRGHVSSWRKDVEKLLHETQIEGVGGSVTEPGEGKIDSPSDKPPPDPAPPVGLDEEKAENRYDALLVAMERKRWDEALRLIAKLSAPPLQETLFVSRHREQIDRMAGRAQLEGDGYAALFRGEVKVGRGREVTITYRFDSAEEEEDWTAIKPFADQGTGFFEHQGDSMRARGVGALVHSAVFEPGTLVMRARLKAVKPTDFGFIFLEPRELMRYYLFTVQNRYFTIGARREKLEENVIWIFGGGAWADNPEGDIGFIRVAKSKTPAVTADEWINLEGAKVDDRVTMKIGRAPPLSGSAKGDDRYTYPALRPGLYVLKSEMIIDEVVIRGVLEEGWAVGAMQKARDRYR